MSICGGVPNRLELNKNASGGNSSKEASKTVNSTDMQTALFAGKIPEPLTIYYLQ
jgi:hypothetical protein